MQVAEWVDGERGSATLAFLNAMKSSVRMGSWCTISSVALWSLAGLLAKRPEEKEEISKRFRR